MMMQNDRLAAPVRVAHYSLPGSWGWAILVVALGAIPSSAWAKFSPAQIARLPPPATGPVEFHRQIQPILEASCIKCHGRGRTKGGFKIDTREALLAGGDSGPVVISGKSAESLLIELVSGVDPENVMPQKGSRLKPEQVGLLRAWIDQGLPWEVGVNLGRQTPVNLLPREVEVPKPLIEGQPESPVDAFSRVYFAQHKITPKSVVEDRVFARRAYLDTIGLLPSTEELDRFLADRRPDKRARLVASLLADNQRYAEHWLTFWNDALRNDYQGTGYIDGGRQQITAWLYRALANNLPYDQFVAQLVNPNAECAGFTKGIVWRGVVNASQTPQMQAAQNISQVFMGINLKCASCHDSFINDWTLADAYGLAGIYADAPLEMVRCDKPTGEKAALKFLFPELGDLGDLSDRNARVKRLAEIVTEKKNGRLTRTIVNRLWARFLGRGLIEPVDEMGNSPWNQDLLDWLAQDLADHGYDLKHTIAQILNSQAYQLPAVNQGDQNATPYVFRGPVVRRLSAEQFLDAVSSLTDLWNPLPANADVDFTAGTNSNTLTAPAHAARWIGKNDQASSGTNSAALYLRRAFVLPKAPLDQAMLVCAADQPFKVYLNGKEALSSDTPNRPRLVDGLPHLKPGENIIAVSLVQKTSAPRFLLYARLREGPTGEGGVIELRSDAEWQCREDMTANWQQPNGSTEGWADANEYGDAADPGLPVTRAFLQAVATASQQNRVRAALVHNNALMTALGRPNREQVVTSRPLVATTLQALELTNGSILAGWLHRGAERLLSEWPASTETFVDRLYWRAYGRPPAPAEVTLANQFAGANLNREGVEDLLWGVTMSPEFQLIY